MPDLPAALGFAGPLTLGLARGRPLRGENRGTSPERPFQQAALHAKPDIRVNAHLYRMYQFRSGFEPPCLEGGGESSHSGGPRRRVLGAAGERPFARSSREPAGHGDGHSTFAPERLVGVRPSTLASRDDPAASSGSSTTALVRGFCLLGMTPREARLYLTLLDGSRSAREASRLAGLHRATGYRVLQRLFDRGLIQGDGRKPQQFRAVGPSLLFHRLELFYRDETEIPSLIAEALGARPGSSLHSTFPRGMAPEPPRILAGESRVVHPALLELSRARQSVGAIVRPLSTPVPYRNALARTLGQLARNGVQVRLITDAMPADHRFCRSVLREVGGAPVLFQVRHYSPLASNLYSIDRQKVIRLPAVGASNRTPPVGVLIEDLTRVRPLVSRFESLWTEAATTPHESVQVTGIASQVTRSGSSLMGSG